MNYKFGFSIKSTDKYIIYTYYASEYYQRWGKITSEGYPWVGGL